MADTNTASNLLRRRGSRRRFPKQDRSLPPGERFVPLKTTSSAKARPATGPLAPKRRAKAGVLPPGIAKRALGLKSARTLAPGRAKRALPAGPNPMTGSSTARPSSPVSGPARAARGLGQKVQRLRAIQSAGSTKGFPAPPKLGAPSRRGRKR